MCKELIPVENYIYYIKIPFIRNKRDWFYQTFRNLPGIPDILPELAVATL